MSFKLTQLSAFLLLLSTCIQAQVLVADINQDNEGSNPEKLVANAEVLSFFARDEIGKAVFKIDSSNKEPIAIHYLNTPSGGTFIWDHSLIGNNLYFITGNASAGEFHKINLISNEYTFLGALAGNPSGSNAGGFTTLGEEVLFFQRDAQFNFRLWKIDTADQMIPIADLPNNSFPEIYFALNDQVFFGFQDTRDKPFHGEIWVSDGTTEGTQLFLDTDPGNSTRFSNSSFSLAGDHFYFRGNTPDMEYKTWKSDGTIEGTAVFRPVINGDTLQVSTYKVLNDQLFFIPDDTLMGAQIYRHDVRNETNQLFFDQRDAAGSRWVRNYFNQDDFLYVMIADSSAVNQLWRSDGTSEGTFLLQNKEQGESYNILRESPFRFLNEELYFIADDGTNGDELWKSDGTITGTKMISDVYPGRDGSGITSLLNFDNKLYFPGESLEFGRELWSSDGSKAGTKLITDINPRQEGNSFPFGFYEFNGELYFNATTSCTGRELYKTQGTAATTSFIKDINPGRLGSDARTFFAYNDRLYFTAENEKGERPFWSTDGTSDGTQIALYSNLGDPSRNTSSPPQVLGDNIIIRSFISREGLGILKSDGTQEGTEIIKIVAPGGTSGSSITFHPPNDSILIFEAKSDMGESIWRTDGTSKGTYIVRSFFNASSIFINYGAFQGSILFKLSFGFGNSSLWKTDGTPEGTIQIGPDGGDLGDVVVHDDRIYFTIRSFGRIDLYQSDGSRFNFQRIRFSGEASGLQSINRLMVLNDKIIFNGSDSQHGSEPWAYDINQQEWALLRDIREGTADGSYLSSATQIGDYLVFNADDGIHGSEAWMTDGTKENTRLAMDLRPGPASSGSNGYYAYNDFLYFPANDGSGIGSELFKFSPYDKDNDGYLPPEDIDDNDPSVNVAHHDPSTDVEVICSVDSVTTSTYQSLSATDIAIFPNPIRDWFQIDINSNDDFIINIFSPNGQRILLSSAHNRSRSYNLSNLPRGNYTLQIGTQNGDLVSSKVLQKL